MAATGGAIPGILKPAELANVQLTEGFWHDRLGVYQAVTIPDVFGKFETDRGGALNNFKRVRDGKSGYHAGPPWYDGLIYECLRGASDFLARNDDPALDERMDGYIELIAAAQEASGDDCLNTYTQLICPETPFGLNGGNLIWQHDLYNTGAMVEAGVHHYKATKKTNMLTVAVKMANQISALIGEAPKLAIVPAHSLPEEAYLKLYRLFRDNPQLKTALPCPVEEKAYYDLARFFIEARGKHERRASYPHYMGEYAQDHRPILEQRTAVGHSVRAALLYAGVAEYANLSGDEGYLQTARALWDDIVSHKLHISGGIGAIHSEEKFGVAYDLPNDAYLETCASVALMFFAKNLFEGSGEAKYIDVLEQALYNCVLTGISLQGDSYFYRNPLQSAGGDHRWPWHDCPCCPPMFLKAMGELPSYFYATGGDCIYVNVYAASVTELSLAGGAVRLRQSGGYPFDGRIRITVEKADARDFALKLRIPAWCDAYTLTRNGVPADARVDSGYAALSGAWAVGDELCLELEMKPRFVMSHPYVKANAGNVALMRGPLLYCLEEADNDMEQVVIPAKACLAVDGIESLPGVPVICFEDTRYRPVVAVPYYLWDNRAHGRMQVWVPMEDFKSAPGGEWGEDLYRGYA